MQNQCNRQNKYFIKTLLNSKMRDHSPPENKLGSYQINCKDCERIYKGKINEICKLGQNNTLKMVKK